MGQYLATCTDTWLHEVCNRKDIMCHRFCNQKTMLFMTAYEGTLHIIQPKKHIQIAIREKEPNAGDEENQSNTNEQAAKVQVCIRYAVFSLNLISNLLSVLLLSIYLKAF